MPARKTKKYEYATLSAPSDEILDRYGADGWRVVTSYVKTYVQPEVYVIIEREVK